MKRILWTISCALAAVGMAAAVVVTLNLRGEEPLPATETLQSTPALVQRGEYLARVGNCMACHTTQGGAPFAGGRGIETPFGVVHSSNLTPDKAHGIGSWTSAEFWRAMHHGRSKDGRLLYPAFPYPNYTQVTREDSDAIFAYLQSQPAVADPNRAHALRFPYNTQAALGVWRALFFTPGAQPPEPIQTAEYNRGAYLVNGLGHCSACHVPRNALGGNGDMLNLSGGLIPMQNWLAPSLLDPAQGGVQDWAVDDIAALLQTGRAANGAIATGPMAEVVQHSTQHWADADLHAVGQAAALAASYNSGQDCTAATRVYVERSAHDGLVESLVETMRAVTLGAPDDGADIGPLISSAHRTRVHGFVDRAVDAGARVLAGGAPIDRDGWFFPPTLLVGVDQRSEVVQDEVFGPVLTVIPFDTEDEAVELANDSQYGLASSVEMPHGGRGASGFGKDMGHDAVADFTVAHHDAPQTRPGRDDGPPSP
eukprot:gene39868-52623_t